jgi:hypothetical protein
VREVSIEELAENANNLAFGDDRLGVMFYNRVVEDKERTLAEGRRCFKDQEFVKIVVPGDRHNVVDRKVQQTGILPTDDRLRFAAQYQKFKAGTSQAMHEGTPITLWPVVSQSLAEELKYINIFTVEQLADLADTYVGKIPNGHSLKEKAKQFILVQKDASVLNKVQMELAQRDNQIETLTKQMADLVDDIKLLRAEAKKAK